MDERDFIIKYIIRDRELYLSKLERNGKEVNINCRKTVCDVYELIWKLVERYGQIAIELGYRFVYNQETVITFEHEMMITNIEDELVVMDDYLDYREMNTRYLDVKDVLSSFLIEPAIYKWNCLCGGNELDYDNVENLEIRLNIGVFI